MSEQSPLVIPKNIPKQELALVAGGYVMMSLRWLHDNTLESADSNRLWLHTAPEERYKLGFVKSFTGEGISRSETYATLALGSLRAFLGGVSQALMPRDVGDATSTPLSETMRMADLYGLFDSKQGTPTPLHANNVWRFRKMGWEFREWRMEKLADAMPTLIPSTRHTRALVPAAQQIYDAHGTAPTSVLPMEDAEKAFTTFDFSTAVPKDLSGSIDMADIFANSPWVTEHVPLYDVLLGGDEHPTPTATAHQMLMTDLRQIFDIAQNGS
jgi:hypothetical protein